MNYRILLLLSIVFLSSLNASEQRELELKKIITMFHYAIHHDDDQQLKLLLESKADPNYKPSYPDKPPLLLAALIDNDSGVKILLDYGADPNKKIDNGRSTILEYISKKKGVSQKIKCLLQAASDKRKALKNTQLYETTFALAYKRQLEGFAGLALPRELVEIEITRFIAAPPYTQEEIEAGLAAIQENIALFKELPVDYEG